MDSAGELFNKDVRFVGDLLNLNKTSGDSAKVSSTLIISFENKIVYLGEDYRYYLLLDNIRIFQIKSRKDCVILFFILENKLYISDEYLLINIIAACFIWGNDYWCDIALNFIDSSQINLVTISSEIKYAIGRKRQLSQKTRNRIFKIHKTIGLR